MTENTTQENQEIQEPESDMEVPTTGSEESGDTLEEDPAPQEVPD